MRFWEFSYLLNGEIISEIEQAENLTEASNLAASRIEEVEGVFLRLVLIEQPEPVSSVIIESPSGINWVLSIDDEGTVTSSPLTP